MPLVAAYSDSEEEGDDSVASDETTFMPVAHSKFKQSNGVPSITPTAVQAKPSEEILEDFVKKVDYGENLPEKPKPASTLSSLRVKGKKSGRIQISIPDILGSDSDDDAPAPKVQKVSSGIPGLLGSLPQPRNMAAGKDLDRRLIPLSLTRPPGPSSTSVKKSNTSGLKSKAALVADTYSDSEDSDEPSTNFFSIGNNVPDNKLSANFFELDGDAGNQAGPSHTINQEPVYQTQPTAASLYNMAAQAQDLDYNSEPPSAEHTEGDDGMQNIINSEEFMRMQGKKHRGKEDIQLIDVNTDDQKASEMELTKNLSHDVDPSMYEHRKTMNLSGQEKRKHQITYLAFQAKEREIELKNSWAEGRHSRKQTQAKYGF